MIITSISESRTTSASTSVMRLTLRKERTQTQDIRKVFALYTDRSFTGFSSLYLKLYMPINTVATWAIPVGVRNLDAVRITYSFVVAGWAVFTSCLYVAPLVETRGTAPQVCVTLQNVDSTREKPSRCSVRRCVRVCAPCVAYVAYDTQAYKHEDKHYRKNLSAVRPYTFSTNQNDCYTLVLSS